MKNFLSYILPSSIANQSLFITYYFFLFAHENVPILVPNLTTKCTSFEIFGLLSGEFHLRFRHLTHYHSSIILSYIFPLKLWILLSYNEWHEIKGWLDAKNEHSITSKCYSRRYQTDKNNKPPKFFFEFR